MFSISGNVFPYSKDHPLAVLRKAILFSRIADGWRKTQTVVFFSTWEVDCINARKHCDLIWEHSVRELLFAFIPPNLMVLCFSLVYNLLYAVPSKPWLLFFVLTSVRFFFTFFVPYVNFSNPYRTYSSPPPSVTQGWSHLLTRFSGCLSHFLSHFYLFG